MTVFVCASWLRFLIVKLRREAGRFGPIKGPLRPLSGQRCDELGHIPASRTNEMGPIRSRLQLILGACGRACDNRALLRRTFGQVGFRRLPEIRFDMSIHAARQTEV